MTFKAAFQFTSKPVITLADLLSKTSAEHPGGLLEQIRSVPTEAACERRVGLHSRHCGLQRLAHTDTAKLDPLLILRTKPETKAANSPRFTFRDRLH